MKTRAIPFIAVLAVCPLLLGCIGVAPVPERNEAYGRPLLREDVKFIRIGSTKRDEVVAQLGTNCISLPRQAALAYTWETGGLAVTWWLFAAVPDAACYEQLGTSHSLWGGWHGFFVGFDTNGCVCATEFKNLSRRALHSQLDDWYHRLPSLPNPYTP